MRKINKCSNNPVDATAAAASLRGLASKAAVALTNPQAPGALCSDDIDGGIYASNAVKNQLKQDQYYKCAYCECFFNGDYGAVEHFRPKSRYQNAAGNPLQLGYWWLAYDWDNLLYSCSECNTGCKRCLFPLVNPNQRNIAAQSIANEQPLLINPANPNTDPKNHIVFNRHIAIGITAEGQTTIDVFKLNDRPLLTEHRLKKWNSFVDVLDAVKGAEKYLNMLASQGNLDDQTITAFRNDIIDKKRKIRADYLDAGCEYVGMFENQQTPIVL